MVKHPQRGIENGSCDSTYKVSRLFVVRWKDILDRLWHFIDKDGNFHTVVYNQNLDKPAIVAGWTTLRDFYHLTGDHQVSLTHYVPNSVTFKVYLTPHRVTCSSLCPPPSLAPSPSLPLYVPSLFPLSAFPFPSPFIPVT
ncbi:hypothetical protein JHK87_042559 [Glycine soja]|nr:hypothetical protein JHK87_042559 [Glycine soja]